MSAFRPLGLAALLDWALLGLERDRNVLGLPLRSIWRGGVGLDLSVPIVGGRVDTPLGPAAGPHTQLAQNLAMAWLAGARVLELKTVQVLDRLDIPRPCIDAPAEGYNVEWSQELTLEQSLEQYVTAWCLVHALAARGLAGDSVAAGVRAGTGLPGTRFDASVGYDLAGIRSERVARFLDGLTDSSRTIAAVRASLPPRLGSLLDCVVPPRVIDTVTLSTFHGCPAEEIESIAEHLFDRHGLNVVIKLNPTLLGHDEVAHLLHDVRGRADLALEPEAFEHDLQWEHAVDMLGRLDPAARRRGLALGVKLTNTLVIRNTRGRLEGEKVYLSGAPLHPIAVALGDRLSRSAVGHLPRSFSAGVDSENFADTVACGFAPVTTCTDLLRPTGYRRLPRYLKALEAEFGRAGVRDVTGYIEARGRESGGTWLGAYAARLAQPGARRSEVLEIAPAAEPRPPLKLFDCAACNRCVLVCPNGAFFSLPLGPRRVESVELVADRGTIERRPAAFETHSDAQWAVDAGLCNACGNCDTWCPESGGPWRVKPRMHRERESYVAEGPGDGIWIEAGGARVSARFDGVEHRLERRDASWVFANDAIEAVLGDDGAVREQRVLTAAGRGTLSLARFHALRALMESTLAEVNPVSVAARENAHTKV